MIEVSGVNFYAVFAAWALSCAFGAFWYSSIGFGKQWTKLTGVDHTKMPTAKANNAIAAIAVAALVQVTTLAIVINSFNVQSSFDAVLLSLLLWFGLVTATTVGNTVYQGQSWKLIGLNSGYFLIVMPISAVLFSL